MILPSIRLYSRYPQRGTRVLSQSAAPDPDTRRERYLLADQSTVLVNMEEIRTKSQTHVASGTHKLCTQACRLNQASWPGSSAMASVARLTPFSIPRPSCTTKAHSAPR